MYYYYHVVLLCLQFDGNVIKDFRCYKMSFSATELSIIQSSTLIDNIFTNNANKITVHKGITVYRTALT